MKNILKKIRLIYLLPFTWFIYSNICAQSGLSVHGYLTQAFAISDGHQVFGIPKEGTFDYRYLALQFRYDLSETNSAVIQLSQRRVGLSPLKDLENDVKLDWAFFEYKLNNYIGFKLGRILIPFGLYNEIRDIGVLLNFYREPFAPYSMGSYLSETVDGFSAFVSLNYDKDKQILLDFYGGNWKLIGWVYDSNLGFVVGDAKVKNGFGSRLLVNTPLQGIDFISSVQRGQAFGGLFFMNTGNGVGEQTINIVNAALSVQLDPWFLYPEYSLYYMTPGKIKLYAYSLLTGYEIFENLILLFSTESIDIRDLPRFNPLNRNIILTRKNSDYLRDTACGLNYKITSNIVLKYEIHWNKSFAVEEIPTRAFDEKPFNTRYMIFSVAASF